MLKATDIHFAYGEKPVLEGVSLHVQLGEVVSLLGPNGTGKSTLLKILVGLSKPHKGGVEVGGDPIHRLSYRERAKKIAYVPQSHQIPFSYEVRAVVLMGRIASQSLFSRYGKEDLEKAEEALEQVGVADLAGRNYASLSGGQRQLVLIARALAQGAELLVMDEPVTGLDYGNQLRLLEQVLELSAKGYTFLQSTHYPDHALMVSHRSVLLHEGKVVADGPPEQVIDPERIETLYGVKVGMETLSGGRKVFLPQLKGARG